MDAYELNRSFRDTIYGEVFWAVHKASGSKVVVKTYLKHLVQAQTTRTGIPVAEDAQKEIKTHAKLSRDLQNLHPNIVRLYAVHEDSKNIYTILEYCGKGELLPFIQAQAFDCKTAAVYARQMMSGVHHMHSQNICHLDISLENLLITDNDVLKICDFGVAIECAAPDALLTLDDPDRRPGKLRYMAPEIFHMKPYNPRLCDVWSCGVVLFVMLLGGFPFEYPVLTDKRFKLVYTGQVAVLLHAWKVTLPNGAVDLLTRMLAPASTRWTCRQILQHPFLQQPTLQ
jgi:serine/threonine-protein kinase SRK2